MNKPTFTKNQLYIAVGIVAGVAIVSGAAWLALRHIRNADQTVPFPQLEDALKATSDNAKEITAKVIKVVTETE